MKKNIYKYRNYRDLLRDYYNSNKQMDRSFTYASFAKKAGLKSTNYLKLVIDGKRNLTPANIQLFAKGMSLKGSEIAFFEALVFKSQAETRLEQTYYSQRMRDLRKKVGNKEVYRKKPDSDTNNTLRIALKLLSEGKCYDEAIKLGMDELGLSKEYSETCINSLLESGELASGKGGVFVLTQKHIMRNDPKNLSHSQSLTLEDGLKELPTVFKDRYSDNLAKFISLLMTAEEGNLSSIFTDLREAVEAIAEKYAPEESMKIGVYRLQLQLYRYKKKER